MLVHTVYFYLKPNTPKAAVEQLVADCRTILTKIPTVRQLFAGVPAGTAERDVIDNSYAVGLTVLFDDLAAHNIYQDHPLHHDFINRNKAHWARVQVYDFA